jgi:hypothetical protein
MSPIQTRSTDLIEAEIAQASAAKRVLLQPKLARFLVSLEEDGVAVPRRLKQLNSDLIDEAIEARFDNMPV